MFKAEFLVTLICIAAIFFMIINYPSWNTAKYIIAILLFYFMIILGLIKIQSKTEHSQTPITKETSQSSSANIDNTKQ